MLAYFLEPVVRTVCGHTVTIVWDEPSLEFDANGDCLDSHVYYATLTSDSNDFELVGKFSDSECDPGDPEPFHMAESKLIKEYIELIGSNL